MDCGVRATLDLWGGGEQETNGGKDRERRERREAAQVNCTCIRFVTKFVLAPD